jgi:hypothetical protein
MAADAARIHKGLCRRPWRRSRSQGLIEVGDVDT